MCLYWYLVINQNNQNICILKLLYVGFIDSTYMMMQIYINFLTFSRHFVIHNQFIKVIEWVFFFGRKNQEEYYSVSPTNMKSFLCKIWIIEFLFVLLPLFIHSSIELLQMSARHRGGINNNCILKFDSYTKAYKRCCDGKYHYSLFQMIQKQTFLLSIQQMPCVYNICISFFRYHL